jgi:GDPmannose 4,6-dehydratase
MQHEKPDDFVFATGETHSVREFVEKTFAHLGIEIGWRGTGENETGVIVSINEDILSCRVRTNKQFVKVNDTVVQVSPSYFRPTEVDLLIGDSSKAEKSWGGKRRPNSTA